MTLFPYLSLLAVLIFSPLALGTRGTGALAVMEILCFLGLAGHCSSLIREHRGLYQIPGWRALLFLQAYILFQIVPLPVNIVRVISPETFDIYLKSAGVMGPLAFMPLSVDVAATVRECFRLSACIVLYVLVIQVLVSGQRIKRTMMILAFLGTAIGVYALIERFWSNGKIYWFFVIPEGNTHIGPYVYKNHYAGFVEMVFLLVFALFCYYTPRFSYNSFRENLIELFTEPGSNRHFLLGLSALILGTSQFVSLSRGGVVCMSLATLGFIMMISLRKNANRKNITVLFFMFLLLLSVSWFGWDELARRFGQALSREGIDLNGRMVFWKDSLNIIRRFPVFGSGFGSFEAIYSTVRTFPGELRVDHAHNDYVELAVTGGMLGLLLVIWFWLSVFVHAFRAFRKRKDAYAVYLFWGAFFGISAIVMHSFTDFNFYNSANALYAFFMAGLLVSAANTRFKHRALTRLKITGRMAPRLMVLPLLLLAAGSLRVNGGGLVGAERFKPVDGRMLTGRMTETELGPIRQAALSAISADPLNARYHLAGALALDYSGEPEAATEHYRRAVYLAPVRAEILQAVGRSFYYHGETETAARLMVAGLDHGPSDTERCKHYGAFFLYTGETERGLEALKRALEMDDDRENINECIAIMVDSGIERVKMLDAMPDRVRPRYILADYMLKNGDAKLADQVETGALDLIGIEEPAAEWMFSRHYLKRIKNNDIEGALDMVNLGLSYLPDHARLRIEAGRLYEKLGIPYRAIEEYTRALASDPGNIWVKRRLETLGEK